MPYSKGYEHALFKKEASQDMPFWPYMSLTLARRLHPSTWPGGFNPSRVLAEIAHLEKIPSARPTGTKPPEKFSGQIMGRFWHKHWTDTPFFAENLKLQWWAGYGKKHKLVENIFKSAYESIGKKEGESLTVDDANKISTYVAAALIDGYERRQSRDALTGEWLIYYMHEGQKYYLDIALHSEQMDESALYERLRQGSEWEFPFAFC